MRQRREDRGLKGAHAFERFRQKGIGARRQRPCLGRAVPARGDEGRNPRPADCWYDLVANALADQAEHLTDEDGRPIRRLMTPQTHACDERKKDLATAHQAVPLADWARETAPREPQLSIPIAPSRLAPYDVDEAGEPVNAPPPPPGAGDEPGEVSPRSATPSDSRFLRGTLTHALLQHLPGLPVSARPEAARAFVERRGREIPAGVRKSIVNETLAILETPGLAPLFGPVSRAEVQINAELPRTTGRGPPLRLSGQIDRLAIDGDSVLIIDYKTNRPAPVDVGLVADAYLFQLAAYRLALAKLFPDKVLRAAIVWTDGPRMMAIPDEIIARYEQRLWDLDTARLDGM